jgi:hypothetical protein
VKIVKKLLGIMVVCAAMVGFASSSAHALNWQTIFNGFAHINYISIADNLTPSVGVVPPDKASVELIATDTINSYYIPACASGHPIIDALLDAQQTGTQISVLIQTQANFPAGANVIRRVDYGTSIFDF